MPEIVNAQTGEVVRVESQLLDMQHSPLLDLFAPAFIAAWSEFPDIVKSRTVDAGRYTYDYAPLDSIIELVRPVLVKNGLAAFQPLQDDGDRLLIQTWVLHASGQFVRSLVACTVHRIRPPSVVDVDEADDGRKRKELPYDRMIKLAGIEITYMRRYALQGILGITAENDTDATSRPARESRPKAAAPKALAAPPAVAATKF